MDSYLTEVLKSKKLAPATLDRALRIRLRSFDTNKDKIPIFKSEIDIIKKQDGNALQRLLFVILVWQKFSKFGNVLCENREIARIAGVKGAKREIGIILNSILSEDEHTDGYLLQLKYQAKKTIIYYVLFEEKNKNQKPLFYVSDIEECESLFPKYFRDGHYCQRCDTKIIKKGQNQKYCNSCSAIVRKEKVSLNVKRFRQKMKDLDM